LGGVLNLLGKEVPTLVRKKRIVGEKRTNKVKKDTESTSPKTRKYVCSGSGGMKREK